MWASPSKIPTKISFISSGIHIKALSDKDKRIIPFVERAAYKTKLIDIKRIVVLNHVNYINN